MKNNTVCSEFPIGNVFIGRNKYYDPVTAAVVGSVVLSAGASVYSGKQQAKAAKEASNAQIEAQRQAAEQDKQLRLDTERNKLTSEKASVDYGIQTKERKMSSSTDLLVENTVGTTNKTTSTLGF